MRDLEASLISLIKGEETKVSSILEKEEIERMFEIGRGYGFITVASLETGHSVQQVAVNDVKGIALEILISPVSASQALVGVKYVPNYEERIAELREYAFC